MPTVVVNDCVASLATGLLLIALGAFRLGGLVRFPVMGGFLAGTGWPPAA
jgi:MFS superfamily sulfate permease-like transporter